MLTVKDFLEKGNLPWYEVLSGEELLDKNNIEFVARQEYNPLYYPVSFDFVRKNELILSTSIGYESDTIFIAFLQWLIDSGSCALIVSVIEDKLQLSTAVRAFLDENPFPVILTPWTTLFADITTSVIKLTNEGTRAESEIYENLQKTLLEGYISGNDLNYAAQILSENLRGRVIIFDSTGNIKGLSKHFRLKDEVPLKHLFENKAKNISISSNGRMYGSVYYESVSPENDLNQSLFMHYLSLPLTLWFDKEWVIQMANQHIKDDFIWRLTKSDSIESQKMYAEGGRLNFYLGGAYNCVVGIINLPFADEDQKLQWISQNISGIKERILNTLSVNWYIMLTNDQSELLLFLQHESHMYAESIDDVLNKLEKELNREYPRAWFSWGICENSIAPTDFKKCYQNAKLAAELCVSQPGKSARFKYEDTILYSAISQLSSDPEMQSKLKNVVSPLLDHDRSTGSSLIDTLECYFTSCQNISETARFLHLHRNSLLYRLNKIEELSGLSLKNADNVFLLELSMKMYSSAKH